jgi:hypothetical protein
MESSFVGERNFNIIKMYGTTIKKIILLHLVNFLITEFDGSELQKLNAWYIVMKQPNQMADPVFRSRNQSRQATTRRDATQRSHSFDYVTYSLEALCQRATTQH